ncbi:MAG: hypothetical protein Q3998_03965 [Porphyromonas sp.]|nr:hypothetical protein [Porphyromonas sp.]
MNKRNIPKSTINNSPKRKMMQVKGVIFLLGLFFLCPIGLKAQNLEQMHTLAQQGRIDEAAEAGMKALPSLKKKPAERLDVLQILTKSHLFGEVEAQLADIKKNKRLPDAIKKKVQDTERMVEQEKRALQSVKILSLVDTLHLSATEIETVLPDILVSLTGSKAASFKEKAFHIHGDYRTWKVERDPEKGTDRVVVWFESTDKESGEAGYTSIPEGLPTDGYISWLCLMPDGQTLYYSYKDTIPESRTNLYVTMFRESDNSFLRSQKLPMPFSSHADDLAYMNDEENDFAFFLSNRNTLKDEENPSYILYAFRPSETGSASPDTDFATLREYRMMRRLEWSKNRLSLRETLGKIGAAKTKTSKAEQPLFYTSSGRAVYVSHSKLTQEYDRTLKEMQADAERLIRLREEYKLATNDKMKQERVRKSILHLEEKRVELQKKLKSLKNTIISTIEP